MVIRHILAQVFLTALLFSPVAAGQFFAAIDDLPLAAGLSEAADEGVVFESPEGRIVTAAARGTVDAGQIRAFYRRVLPSLGWRPDGDGKYLREGARLSFSIETSAGIVTLRVRMVNSDTAQ